MGGYKPSLSDNWYCCVCKSDKGLLQNPNSANSETCEDRSCKHSRCDRCPSDGGYGPAVTLPRESALSVSPSQPRVLVQNNMEEIKGGASFLIDRPSSQSSQSSSIEHGEALSSTRESRGATDAQTAATTVSNTAKNADMDDSDNYSVTSNIGATFPEVWIRFAQSLARDLKDADLAQSGDMLVEQLEEFSLRFGNENANADHLRMISIVYQHARYESLHKIMLWIVMLFNSCFILNEIINFV